MVALVRLAIKHERVEAGQQTPHGKRREGAALRHERPLHGPPRHAALGVPGRQDPQRLHRTQANTTQARRKNIDPGLQKGERPGQSQNRGEGGGRCRYRTCSKAWPSSEACSTHSHVSAAAGSLAPLAAKGRTAPSRASSRTARCSTVLGHAESATPTSSSVN